MSYMKGSSHPDVQSFKTYYDHFLLTYGQNNLEITTLTSPIGCKH
jgi:hypothetical protein